MYSPYPTREPEGFERHYIIFWFLLLTALAGAGAYLTIMTGFYLHDDEGALMIGVKQYVAGMKIYDQVFSCYGPLYYLYQLALRTATATPVTHDVVRISALFPWLAITMISSWITLRLTRSLVLAAMTHLVASLVLVTFRTQPGHPSELTLLLLVALAAAPLIAPLAHRRMVLMLMLGGLCAALLLVKINAGVFAAAAVAMTCVSCGPRSRAGRVLALAAGAACTLLPVILIRNHLGAPWARSYCWLEVASAGACVCCMLWSRRGSLVTLRDDMWAAGGFAAALVAVLTILQKQGVSISEVYDSVLVAPSRIFLAQNNWFLPPQLLEITPFWALAGLGMAIFIARRKPLRGTPEWQMLFAGKTAFALLALLTIVFHRRLLTIVTPFAWLLLFHPNEEEDSMQSFPRRLLAILTVLQTLYAYPVAGSQASVIQILLVVTVAVCVGDSLAWLTQSRPIHGKFTFHWRIVATAVLSAIAVVDVGVVTYRYVKYQSLPSLDLPGARLVHTEPDTKANLEWVVRNLRQRCDSFESLPGLYSLNFWTGIEPLTGFNIDNWTVTLSSDQQKKVVAAISSHPRACVVYNRPLTEFWNPAGEQLEKYPLAGFIFRNFEPVDGSGDYQLLVRKERTVSAAVRSDW
jgi:hypothetical protein